MGTTVPFEPPKFSGGDDAARLIWMLQTSRQILFDLVHYSDLVDAQQRNRFAKSWPEVEMSFQGAVSMINQTHASLLPKLIEAGMAGPMLEMKADSLQRCVDKLYQEVPTGSPFFKLKWLKPTTKCVNSIVGSLLRAIPGLEIAKEYKDHLEVAMDLAEAAKSQ